jgi:hypothetical protein
MTEEEIVSVLKDAIHNTKLVYLDAGDEEYGPSCLATPLEIVYGSLRYFNAESEDSFIHMILLNKIVNVEVA